MYMFTQLSLAKPNGIHTVYNLNNFSSMLRQIWKERVAKINKLRKKRTNIQHPGDYKNKQEKSFFIHIIHDTARTAINKQKKENWYEKKDCRYGVLSFYFLRYLNMLSIIFFLFSFFFFFFRYWCIHKIVQLLCITTHQVHTNTHNFVVV